MGETETGDADPDLGICEQYIDCIEAAAPETLTATKAYYGIGGACWDLETSSEDDCRTECRGLLRAIVESFPEVEECFECVEDTDCTADMPYCRADEGLCNAAPDGEDDPTCTPMGGLGLGDIGQTLVYGSTAGESDVYSGSCGGAGGNEQVYVFVPPLTGMYFISVAADFDTVLYLRDGNDCTGVELACEGDAANGPNSSFEIELQGNQYHTIFVDSHGESGDYSLYIEHFF
jgi:hypothetical protein